MCVTAVVFVVAAVAMIQCCICCCLSVADVAVMVVGRLLENDSEKCTVHASTALARARHTSYPLPFLFRVELCMSDLWIMTTAWSLRDQLMCNKQSISQLINLIEGRGDGGTYILRFQLAVVEEVYNFCEKKRRGLK